MGSALSSCLFEINILNFFLHVNMSWNEKSSWFSNLPFIRRMLGWNSYFQIALSTESERLPESWFIISVFSFIFKFEIAFLKKVFNLSAIFWSSYNNSLSSTSCIFEPRSSLFEKIGLTVFQKVCYLSQMMDLVLHNRLPKFFCFLKVLNELFVRW